VLHNDGNYIISLGQLCRWLAAQAEELGVEIYPGFSASEVREGMEARSLLESRIWWLL
jgi:flavin-dependent dehydrogenase